MLLLFLISVTLYLLGNNSMVIMNVTVTQPTALINVTLPIQPMGPITVMNSSGYAVPALLINNNLVIPVFGNGTFTVEYIPRISMASNGFLEMHVSSKYPISLYVSNVLLSSLPMNLITNFTKTSSGYIIQLAPGNYTIEFTPQPPTITPPTVTKTNITTTVTNTTTTITSTITTNTTTTSASTKPSIKPSGFGFITYLIPTVIIAAVVILLIYIFIIRGRTSVPEPIITEGLNPTDRDVLKALVELGGDVYQVDLQKKLNMPKATLWRSIRRLEEAGYVKVIKEGKYNRIKLIKKPD